MTRRAMTSGADSFGRPGPRRVAIPILLACVLVLSLRPANAQQTQEGTMVTFPARGERVQGYLVRPAAAGFHSGVVLVHEWWGLNDQIKGVANRLAGEGYVVIVPDLYRGKLGKDAGWARILSQQLDESWAVDVLGAAATWLRTMDENHARRLPSQKMPVAIWGIGMGGRLSLAAALEGKDIQAVIMLYGSVVSGAEKIRPLGVPLLGIFGEEDRGVPKDQVKAFEATLKSEGKDATILLYRAVGTSFFNETRPGYDKTGAKMAWERTLQFLQEKLGAPAVAAPQGQTRQPEG